MKVKFNILNLSKPTSLYNKGMKVLIYSKQKVNHTKTGWYRGGSSILYYQNWYRRVSFRYYEFLFRKYLRKVHNFITRWHLLMSLNLIEMKYTLLILYLTHIPTLRTILTTLSKSLVQKCSWREIHYEELWQVTDVNI